MSLTGFRCAECGERFEIRITHNDVWTAFCTPEHAAKWQAGKTEQDIIKHQFGDTRPWSPFDRCQWCHCTLKSGYHEDDCPVRKVLEKTKL